MEALFFEYILTQSSLGVQLCALINFIQYMQRQPYTTTVYSDKTYPNETNKPDLLYPDGTNKPDLLYPDETNKPDLLYPDETNKPDYYIRMKRINRIYLYPDANEGIRFDSEPIRI